jgi:hypothetical protein
VLASTEFDPFVSSVAVLVGMSRKTGVCQHYVFVLRYNNVCYADELCSAGTLLILQSSLGSFSLSWFLDAELASYDA